MEKQLPTLAVIGGTGKEGTGLIARWASAGYQVVIGGRLRDRAVAVATELNDKIPGNRVTGATNPHAAREGDIVVLTVPYAAQQETALSLAAELRGKILVDVTVPLVPPKVARVHLADGGSAVLALQKALGDQVRVVSAFQNVSAHHLLDLGYIVDCDVLVAGDDPAAREEVIKLACAAKLRGLHAGPLVNSVVAETLTSVLISINQRYKVPAAGIRITGLSEGLG